MRVSTGGAKCRVESLHESRAIPAKSPCITVKDVFKHLVNVRLCKMTERTLETKQNGILVNLIFDHPDDKAEMENLRKLKDDAFLLHPMKM